MDQPVASNEIQIPPRRKGQLIYVLCFVLFMPIASISLAVPIIGKEADAASLGIGAFFLIMSVLMAFVIFISRRVVVLNDEGIRYLKRSKFIARWADVADIELGHPLGIGELVVKFLNSNRKTIGSLTCEYMDDGGRLLIDQLHKRLPAIFDRHARQYLTGEFHWQQGAMKDVIRFENGMLFVNVPRPRIIPFNQIKRIEWIPGIASGARRGGYICIEFGSERVELPVKIKGIHYFIFAAKYMFGLGDRVNPPFPAGVREQIDTSRKKQSSLHITRMVCSFLIFWPIIMFMRVLPGYIGDSSAQSTGVERTAVISSVKGDSVELKYKRSKIEQTAKVEVRNTFLNAHRVGDKIKIKVHRNNPKWVVFDGKIMTDARRVKISAIVHGIVMFGGIVLLLWTELRRRHLTRETERLEREAAAMLQR